MIEGGTARSNNFLCPGREPRLTYQSLEYISVHEGIDRGRGLFGILEVGWVCGAAVGPALTGYIFDATGGYDVAFFLGVLAALVIIFLLLLIKVPLVKTGKRS